MRRCALVVLTICCTFSVAAPVDPEAYNGPIIDMHQHADAEIFRDKQFCFPQPCEGAPTKAKTAADLKPMTLDAMERNNIVLGVISEMPDNVLDWTASEGGRYLVGINIGDPDEIPLDELRELFTSGQAHVLGEIFSQYEGVAINDPSLDPLFSMAHELDIPVHVHVLGIGGSADFPSDLGNPLRLVPVLRKYPDLRIYLENAGWPFLEEVTALMYQYPGVYAEVSTILHLIPRPVAHDYLRRLFENGLGKRIMFGSDQMIWPEVIDVAVDAVNSAEFLTQEQKADVFYNNAARFLRLSPKQIAAHHQH
jgi:predicted TIM-barrel fold metal-dependent hydrolase